MPFRVISRNRTILPLFLILACLSAIVSSFWLGAQTAPESQTLHASFDKNVVADEAIGDETPLISQGPKIVREGRRGSALLLDIGSVLSYDAPGNVYAERGTLGFWWKLDEPLGRTQFSLVRISQLRPHNADYDFIHLFWTGEDLRIRIYDKDGVVHEVVSASKTELVSGRWFHLAFSWDELWGIRLYVDGHQ